MGSDKERKKREKEIWRKSTIIHLLNREEEKRKKQRMIEKRKKYRDREKEIDKIERRERE